MPESHHPSLPILHEAYRLTLWMINHSRRMDRSLRFQLGERLQAACLELCKALNATRHAKRIDRPLARADQHLDDLRLLLNLSVDLRVLSPRQYGYVSDQILSIGNQLGGWRRKLRSGL